MKIEYKFVTGEKVHIGVTGELEEIMLKFDNELKNNNRKETRRHESLELLDNDAKSMDITEDILEDVCKTLEKDKLYDAIDTLTLQEQDFINKVFLQKNPITYSEHAKQSGIKENSLYQKLWRIKEKLKKVLNV